MAEFIDLHLRVKALESKARELGFSRAVTPLHVVLRKSGDLKLVKTSGLQSVEGKSSDLLRKACLRARVLINPVFVRNYQRDDGLIRAVKEHDCVFEIPVAYLLCERPAEKAKRIRRVGEFVKRCVKLKTSFVLVSDASEEAELKSPREVIAVGVLLGLTQELAGHCIGKRASAFLGEVE
ncbi:MAG: RNase P subunit p30 family protein [Candidatus Micrarchaeota archaeon]